MMENRQTSCQNTYRTRGTGNSNTNVSRQNFNNNINNHTPSRRELMQRINHYSFAVVEATLFLDTHPYDEKAMEYFQKYRALRMEALQEYAKYYAPLVIDYASNDRMPWSWANEPWPWEGVES